MTSPSELTLDYKPSIGYPHIQKSPYSTDQPDQQTQKLEDFLSRLEEERLKIEAFKRELPLCMQLLNSAMETYKQQLEGYRSSPPRPVLEEFIPMKLNIDSGAERATNPQSEKANWMVSAQLWTAAGDAGKQHQPPIKFDTMSPKLSLDSKQRNGGAFLPFSKEKGKGSVCATPRVMPELSLGSPESEMEDKKCSDMEKAEEGKGGGSANDTQTSSAVGQAHRKARRSWSPDLHRRFVNALQILGGSQVATPKQIRELMKVDGLTNDEVKSHLQKYRLHTRRPIPGPQAASAAPQLVVLGGIWVPPEYATSAAAAVGGPAGIYGSHTAHYCAAPMPQEFYTAAPPLQHLHPPPLHRSATVVPRQQYNGGNGSPETDVRSGWERSESVEEGTEDGEGREEDEEETEEEVVMAGGDVALKF